MICPIFQNYSFFCPCRRTMSWERTLLEILSFVTNHYAIGMQLVVIYNYLGHVCNYKFGIIYFFSHMVMCAINVQLNVYNMGTCHKNNGIHLYILNISTIYLHRLCIIILCAFSTKVNPMLI